MAKRTTTSPKEPPAPKGKAAGKTRTHSVPSPKTGAARKTTGAAKTARKTASGARPPPPALRADVPNVVEREIDATPDQPFAEGARDAIDPDLRHRMISEAAYRHYIDRGYEDGYDLDDWLQAEAEVDHLLLNRPGR